MNEDIRKIIESVQQGNIDADEASQLIQALKPEPEINHTEGYLKKACGLILNQIQEMIFM